MASVDSLTFDLADCELVQADSERIWVSPAHVAYRLEFDRGGIYGPFDLTDPAAARWQCVAEQVTRIAQP